MGLACLSLPLDEFSVYNLGPGEAGSVTGKQEATREAGSRKRETGNGFSGTFRAGSAYVDSQAPNDPVQ
jgi:hypothetical protein